MRGAFLVVAVMFGLVACAPVPQGAPAPGVQPLPAPSARDASGLAAHDGDGEFLVSGGDGALRLVNAQSGESRPLTDAPLHWDNHLAAS